MKHGIDSATQQFTPPPRVSGFRLRPTALSLALAGLFAPSFPTFAVDAIIYFPIEASGFGTHTLIRTFGSESPSSYTQQIIGSETVTYRSDPLTGSLVTNFFFPDGDAVVNQTENEVRIIKAFGEVVSDDVSMTSHSPLLTFADIQDGDTSIGNFFLGGERERLAILFKLDDVTVQGQAYANSLVLWYLDEDVPYATPKLGAISSIGLTPPTSAETGGVAVTEGSVYAAGVGQVVLADVDAVSGNVLTVFEYDGVAPPRLTIASATIAEGNTGTVNLRFKVRLSAPAPAAVRVNFATQDGTAKKASDYVAKTGTLTIAKGKSSGDIVIQVKGDTAIESNETFKVLLSNPRGASITTGTATGTIRNDDRPRLSINDVSLAEGNSGQKNATFTVRLSPAPKTPVTVKFATVDGTAKKPTDYVAKSGTINFAAGQTAKTIQIVVKGDRTQEANETFRVNLSAATGASIADGQSVGTISNDD